MFYHLSGMVRKLNNLPLKTIAVSGECMTTAVAERLRIIFPNTDIYHVYGLTEASPRVS
jgi:acyl-CoA synthetase (AMP-forming)/AMP-acid ligase II